MSVLPVVQACKQLIFILMTIYYVCQSFFGGALKIV
jgi:hypothetical protein